MKRGNLFLELKKGTTVQEAQEIARYLKERATHLAFLPLFASGSKQAWFLDILAQVFEEPERPDS